MKRFDHLSLYNNYNETEREFIDNEIRDLKKISNKKGSCIYKLEMLGRKDYSRDLLDDIPRVIKKFLELDGYYTRLCSLGCKDYGYKLCITYRITVFSIDKSRSEFDLDFSYNTNLWGKLQKFIRKIKLRNSVSKRFWYSDYYSSVCKNSEKTPIDVDIVIESMENDKILDAAKKQLVEEYLNKENHGEDRNIRDEI